MTHDEHTDSQSGNNAPQRDPLIMRFYGWKSVARTALGMGALAYVAGWSIYAITTGRQLWISIPFALLFTASLLAVIKSAVINPKREGLIIDRSGIHTTLRGTRMTSFPWETIEAVGLSYSRWDAKGNNTYNPRSDLLDVFSSVPRDSDISTRGGRGCPKRIEHEKLPYYGVPNGHARISLNGTSAPARQEIRDALKAFDGRRFINDFERPESLRRTGHISGSELK